MKCPECGQPLTGLFLCQKCEQQADSYTTLHAWLGNDPPSGVIEFRVESDHRGKHFVLLLRASEVTPSQRQALIKAGASLSHNPYRDRYEVRLSLGPRVNLVEAARALWGDKEIPF